MVRPKRPLHRVSPWREKGPDTLRTGKARDGDADRLVRRAFHIVQDARRITQEGQAGVREKEIDTSGARGGRRSTPIRGWRQHDGWLTRLPQPKSKLLRWHIEITAQQRTQ